MGITSFIRGVAFAGDNLIRGVAFAGDNLIREVAFAGDNWGYERWWPLLGITS